MKHILAMFGVVILLTACSAQSEISQPKPEVINPPVESVETPVETPEEVGGSDMDKEPVKEKAVVTGSKSELQTLCESNRGVWVEDALECEYLDQVICEENGGEFNSCASACRHDKEAQMCTMQCVLVCDFDA